MKEAPFAISFFWLIFLASIFLPILLFCQSCPRNRAPP